MQSRPIKIYRLINFSLAGCYFGYLFLITDYTAIGWQFRYLTIWALTANFFVSALMLNALPRAVSEAADQIVTTAVILNAVVVFLYWKLHFIDPKLINGENPRVWYLDYYLHLFGPLMQWLDAIFIYGAFRRQRQTLQYILILFFSYTLWIELIVQPYNSLSQGTVTSGLPYPFLNDLNFIDRLKFYSSNMLIIVACFFIGVGARYLKRKIIHNKK